MNVRKPVDYGTMYRELTVILAQKLSQMDEIYAIGKTISQRPEKGAAVAAAEFLRANFPDRTGFSPRNVRRQARLASGIWNRHGSGSGQRKNC